jgi:hypothetical protein
LLPPSAEMKFAGVMGPTGRLLKSAFSKTVVAGGALVGAVGVGVEVGVCVGVGVAVGVGVGVGVGDLVGDGVAVGVGVDVGVGAGVLKRFGVKVGVGAFGRHELARQHCLVGADVMAMLGEMSAPARAARDNKSVTANARACVFTWGVLRGVRSYRAAGRRVRGPGAVALPNG